MSESTTIARPYAKALFEHALAQNTLAQWSEYLLILAQTVLTEEAEAFIANPSSTEAQKSSLLHAVVSSKAEADDTLKNFITLLTTNKRLMLLPEIKALYEIHRAEQEKTLDVHVSSFAHLTSEQEQKMMDSLSQLLKRRVSLKINIDSSLLGGAVIQAGDLVIDGSVRGKLNKLITDLAA